MSLSKTDFDYIAWLVHEEAAIVLEPGKEYLVINRLTPLAEQEGYGTLDKFIGKLRSESIINGLHHKSVDAMTTHETSFFRDFHPFEALRQEILPRLIAQRRSSRHLNIWSAACSTGQEPYSVAMLLLENFPELADWHVSILATDISPPTLKLAEEGSYSQFDVNRGLPAKYLVKYFVQKGNRWCVKPEVKRHIDFRPMNLHQPWPMLPAFDLVFLRNVMIYFDADAKRSILKQVRGCLQPHGFLFLGSAETTVTLDPEYRPVTFGHSAVYMVGRQ